MMSPVTIKIDIGNAAFSPDPTPEIVRILRDLAQRLENEPDLASTLLFDTNGNRCGYYQLPVQWPAASSWD